MPAWSLVLVALPPALSSPLVPGVASAPKDWAALGAEVHALSPVGHPGEVTLGRDDALPAALQLRHRYASKQQLSIAVGAGHPGVPLQLTLRQLGKNPTLLHGAKLKAGDVRTLSLPLPTEAHLATVGAAAELCVCELSFPAEFPLPALLVVARTGAASGPQSGPLPGLPGSVSQDLPETLIIPGPPLPATPPAPPVLATPPLLTTTTVASTALPETQLPATLLVTPEPVASPPLAATLPVDLPSPVAKVVLTPAASVMPVVPMVPVVPAAAHVAVSDDEDEVPLPQPRAATAEAVPDLPLSADADAQLPLLAAAALPAPAAPSGVAPSVASPSVVAVSAAAVSDAVMERAKTSAMLDILRRGDGDSASDGDEGRRAPSTSTDDDVPFAQRFQAQLQAGVRPSDAAAPAAANLKLRSSEDAPTPPPKKTRAPRAKKAKEPAPVPAPTPAAPVPAAAPAPAVPAVAGAPPGLAQWAQLPNPAAPPAPAPAPTPAPTPVLAPTPAVATTAPVPQPPAQPRGQPQPQGRQPVVWEWKSRLNSNDEDPRAWARYSATDAAALESAFVAKHQQHTLGTYAVVFCDARVGMAQYRVGEPNRFRAVRRRGPHVDRSNVKRCRVIDDGQSSSSDSDSETLLSYSSDSSGGGSAGSWLVDSDSTDTDTDTESDDSLGLDDSSDDSSDAPRKKKKDKKHGKGGKGKGRKPQGKRGPNPNATVL